MKKSVFSGPIEKKFLDAISQYNLVRPGERVLIALSGGPDSVLLAFLFGRFKTELKIIPVLIHINHHLRGKAGDKDEAFSHGIADRLGLEFMSKDIDVISYSGTHKLSLETAARTLRYRAFEEAMKEKNCQKLATAHHLDDLAETMIFRLLKGSGVSGLAAIPVKRGNIIRPLLYCEKKEINDYLKRHHINYRTDSSNKKDVYDRNYIRKRVIPVFEKRFPAFRRKFLDLYEIIQEEEQVWQDLLEPMKNSVHEEEGLISINKTRLIEKKIAPKALLRRFLRWVIQNHVSSDFFPNSELLDKILSFCKNRDGNRTIFKNNVFRIVSSYDKVFIEKTLKKFPKKPKYVKLNHNSSVFYGRYSLIFERTAGGFNRSDLAENTCVFNAAGIFALTVRQRREGDRIKIAAGRTKKVKDFYIDNKFSVFQREKSFLLEAEDGKIAAIFVPGYGFRVSADFYVNKESGEKVSVRAVKMPGGPAD